MDLKDFIAQTLVQIVAGVTDAQRQIGEQAAVSPVVTSNYDHAADLGFISTQNGQAPVVKFDVAVSASQDQGSKGGANVNVMDVFSLGGEKTTANMQSSISRVQFAVPVVLPGGEQSTVGPSSPMPTRKRSR